jgi:hypothetical protein
MNFKEKLLQNAGNRISEVLDFKISRGRIPTDPPTSARFSASVNKTTGPPLVLHAYKIHCSIFLYLRSLRNTACARLLLCYIPSRNITISELTKCIKPKITNQKLKDHVKSVLRISCAHNKINKWGPQI